MSHPTARLQYTSPVYSFHSGIAQLALLGELDKGPCMQIVSLVRSVQMC